MKKIALIILLIVCAFIFLRFIIGGSEDNWLCQNGQWVKHGNPSSPKPEAVCSSPER